MSAKAAIWVRVSTDRQHEDNQIPDLERLCQHRGWEITRRHEIADASAYKGEHPETGHHQDDRQKPPLLVLAEKGHEISDERGLGLVRGPLEGGSFMTRVGLLHLWHPQNWRK